MLGCADKTTDSTITGDVYLGPGLCSTMVAEENPNLLFKSELVSVDAIQSTYPYGDTQPDDPETINGFELGNIKNAIAYANVKVNSPSDLYIRTIQVSRFDRT
jgi:hypothetical protein